jgi:cellulose 1,4-beta-cellobiosidase
LTKGGAERCQLQWTNPVHTNPRVYLMANNTRYQMFSLPGNEIAVDLDLSTVPCGLNAAMYFVEMEADGGTTRFPNNAAGARFGTVRCLVFSNSRNPDSYIF